MGKDLFGSGTPRKQIDEDNIVRLSFNKQSSGEARDSDIPQLSSPKQGIEWVDQYYISSTLNGKYRILNCRVPGEVYPMTKREFLGSLEHINLLSLMMMVKLLKPNLFRLRNYGLIIQIGANAFAWFSIPSYSLHITGLLKHIIYGKALPLNQLKVIACCFWIM